MLSEVDTELLGVSNRTDGMGLLAVWSTRGRDLVPHLTEQTTSVRGFQLLVEAVRLWELYEPAHPQHAGRVGEFFILVEQAFARTLARRDHDWKLPGSRRARGRADTDPHISLEDHSWHLLGNQQGNGLWGLYRGAARRAGLIAEQEWRLSAETMSEATRHAGLTGLGQKRLFALVKRALEGETVALPVRANNRLVIQLCETYDAVPLRHHLHAKLISGHELNSLLATRLREQERFERRSALRHGSELAAYRTTIEAVIRCENLLAMIDSVFVALCAGRGQTVEAALADLPLELDRLEHARQAFADSGDYGNATAARRHARIHEQLDTRSLAGLGRSILLLHDKVSKERGRAPWVWLEGTLLRSDVDFERPDDKAFELGIRWRHDYYLYPLQCIATQLAELGL